MDSPKWERYVTKDGRVTNMICLAGSADPFLVMIGTCQTAGLTRTDDDLRLVLAAVNSYIRRYGEHALRYAELDASEHVQGDSK